MKALFVAAALLLTMASTHAEAECLTYDSNVTLTGTIVVRHIDFGPVEPKEWSEPFPMLVLDQVI